ncbi:MAG TPA: Nif3-like dinuclear metal center hexameric protein, partial [Thermoanaerobaculia bacterium]|nr:Nif3-like dinuclear metal center hexameric protein [Thermoanaerobaculia bacterium]
LPVGVKGRFPAPIPAAELLERTRRIYAQEPLAYMSGPAAVSALGIISGGGQRDFYSAIEEGLDAYITGVVTEWVMNVARESRVHYLAAGHYATERLGVRALGEHLRERFGVEVEYIDVPNPA